MIGDDDVCLVFYNITWNNNKLTGTNKDDHEKALRADLDDAAINLDADAIFLS